MQGLAEGRFCGGIIIACYREISPAQVDLAKQIRLMRCCKLFGDIDVLYSFIAPLQGTVAKSQHNFPADGDIACEELRRQLRSNEFERVATETPPNEYLSSQRAKSPSPFRITSGKFLVRSVGFAECAYQVALFELRLRFVIGLCGQRNLWCPMATQYSGKFYQQQQPDQGNVVPPPVPPGPPAPPPTADPSSTRSIASSRSWRCNWNSAR